MDSSSGKSVNNKSDQSSPSVYTRWNFGMYNGSLHNIPTIVVKLPAVVNKKKTNTNTSKSDTEVPTKV